MELPATPLRAGKLLATLTLTLLLQPRAAGATTTTPEPAPTTTTTTTPTLGPSGLNDELRTLIVDRLNFYRTILRASNMLAVRWENDLEAEAAAWVSKCVFEHQPDPVWGENIYRSEFNRPRNDIISTGLASWNLEKSFVGAQSCCDATLNATLCCNYQQMVWAQTRMVGCALNRCPVLKGTDVEYLNTWFLACYFQPRGNVAGFQPFGTGAPCSACPWTYDVCYRNLCWPSPNCTNPNI